MKLKSILKLLTSRRAAAAARAAAQLAGKSKVADAIDKAEQAVDVVKRR